jgi:Cdc6-like AAA superfamily ATPase
MMDEDTHFPSTLLHRPSSERLAYFKAYTVAHTHMEQVFAALVQAIREPANAAYILVLGPTGVGKTTLRLGVERHLVATLQTELERDPDRLPVCSTTAVSPDSGNFNWKDYYRRALQTLDEPVMRDKIRIGTTRPLAVAEATALRRALESALTHRRPQAFIVDEAQHLLKIASGRRLQDQMDSIKSLADHGQTVHVLIGTYDLLALQTLNGQVIRRGITLHFPRYRADIPADVLAFQRVLVSFEQQLPVPQPPDLFSLDRGR